MRCYYINLDTRRDRDEKFKKMILDTDINEYQRFNAIRPLVKDISYDDFKGFSSPRLYTSSRQFNYDYIIPALGCKRSHMSILEKYNENHKGDDHLLILEDDVYFNCVDVVKRCQDTISLLSNKNQDWTILYLGGNSTNGILKPIKNDNTYPFIEVQGMLCTHAYVVNPKKIGDVLNLLKTSSAELDVCYSKMNGCYVMSPKIAFQSPSWSDVLNRYVDYEHVLK